MDHSAAMGMSCALLLTCLLLTSGCSNMTYTPPPLSPPPKVDAWAVSVRRMVAVPGFAPTQVLATSRVHCESLRADIEGRGDTRNYKLVTSNCGKVTVINGKGNSGWWGYWTMPQGELVGIAIRGGIECDKARQNEVYAKPAYPVSSCVPMEMISE